MLPLCDLPEIAFVRVLSAGGPYAVDDTLSLAFSSAGIARLASHDGAAATPQAATHFPLVPESISVSVSRAAGPYARGDLLTLSFVEPHVARVHPNGAQPTMRESGIRPQGAADERLRAATLPNSAPLETTSARFEPSIPAGRRPVAPEPAPMEVVSEGLIAATEASASPRSEVTLGATDSRTDAIEARDWRVRLAWNPERVRRFVQVTDKLFTVDRLGWYRHALAMRLLVPDTIETGDPHTDLEVMQHLQALRAAVVETLGRPLLAAFMPNFSVSSEWLSELDSAAAVRAVAGLRDASRQPGDEPAASVGLTLEPGWTVGAIAPGDFVCSSGASLEAVLPLFIPCRSTVPALTDTLGEYRRALLEVFGQTADSAVSVRLKQMAQPNHALDDRLWQLVGSVGESLGGLSVA